MSYKDFPKLHHSPCHCNSEQQESAMLQDSTLLPFTCLREKGITWTCQPTTPWPFGLIIVWHHLWFSTVSFNQRKLMFIKSVMWNGEHYFCVNQSESYRTVHFFRESDERLFTNLWVFQTSLTTSSQLLSSQKHHLEEKILIQKM